jgi:outer membrane protein assembly factor BamB
LDAKSGSVKWQFPAGTPEAPEAFLSTPILTDDTLYMVSERGEVYAFLVKDGSSKWVFSPVKE